MRKLTMKFSGVPDSEVDKVEGNDGEMDTVTEEERLAVTVRDIDYNASIIPRGAYIAEATHDVIRNRYFEGLNVSNASILNNYYHFRPANEGHARHLLKQNGLLASTDFLDNIASDLPLGGSWAITFNEAKTAVSVRSLVYPGYFFWHVLNTNKFGGAYFGSGLKENDIVFMF